MNNLEPRQDDLQKSLVSFHRLRAIQREIRIAADKFQEPRAYPDARPNLERHLRWLRVRPDVDSLVVGAEYEHASRVLIASIEDAVQDLARHCDHTWRRGRMDGKPERKDRGDEEVWTLGKVDFLVEVHPILRGDIELRKTEPIAPGLPDVVVEYLVTVPGTRDQLVRESHGHWGYHYHYLDSRNRRSDTLLTFDRIRPPGAMPTLSWERHAEGQKYKARAGMWGKDKRESVYSVCQPDTLRFSPGDFKRPASDAQVVWPLNICSLPV